MTERSDLPRLYGEQEIGRILKRATELQHSEPTAPSAGGVTLAELEEIAAEAGIDPRYLRRAALELDSGTGDTSFWARVVGDELMLTREIVLPGELGADGFERILSTIQAHTRLHGQPGVLGRTLTWRAETPSKSRTMQVVVSTRDGHTHIRMEENLGQLASGLFAGVTAGFGVGVGAGVTLPIALEVLGSAALAVAGPIGFVTLSYVACRGIYRSVTRRRRNALDGLLERVVAEAQASIAAATVAPPPERPAPLPPGA